MGATSRTKSDVLCTLKEVPQGIHDTMCCFPHLSTSLSMRWSRLGNDKRRPLISIGSCSHVTSVGSSCKDSGSSSWFSCWIHHAGMFWSLLVMVIIRYVCAIWNLWEVVVFGFGNYETFYGRNSKSKHLFFTEIRTCENCIPALDNYVVALASGITSCRSK